MCVCVCVYYDIRVQQDPILKPCRGSTSFVASSSCFDFGPPGAPAFLSRPVSFRGFGGAGLGIVVAGLSLENNNGQ